MGSILLYCCCPVGSFEGSTLLYCCCPGGSLSRTQHYCIVGVQDVQSCRINNTVLLVSRRLTVSQSTLLYCCCPGGSLLQDKNYCTVGVQEAHSRRINITWASSDVVNCLAILAKAPIFV